MDSTRQYGYTLSDIRRDHVARYEFAASKLKHLVVLDAACGIGYGSHLLYKADNEVTGVDIDKEAIDWANAYWPGPTYLHGELSSFELETDAYDAVVSFETLEHLDDPRQVLKAFRDAATILIASVPNQERYPFVAENFAKDAYPHKRHYTPAEFESLLNEAGWDVLERHCQKSKTADVEWGTDGMFLVYVCR